MPKLQLVRPDGSQTDHELTEETVTIGRAADCILKIDDASISGHHAKIAPGKGGYRLTDTGSTNGTRLNGEVLEPDVETALKPGDKIRFGKVDAVYDPDATEDGGHELPSDAARVLAPAAQSIKPSSFMNASPFQKRVAKKDPIAAGAIIIGVIAILTSLVTLLIAMNMKGL